ncbi:MAG TPA: hypothetical protein VFY27_06620 [Woeseiaceae bacterium]|nr:hypothetical protein [Woeseiaceae bacterium]
MSVDDYAILTLVTALITVSAGLGQFGADSIVNRHVVAPDLRMFFRVFCTSMIAALVTITAAVGYYGTGWPVALLLGFAIVCQSVVYFAAAYSRSQHNFRVSLLVFNSFNYVLLAIAIVVSLQTRHGILYPLAAITCLLFMTAAWSLVHLRRKYSTISASYSYNWREALVWTSITGSAVVLLQLERLITPKLLTLEDLATLGILLAIVGPPFRLLQLTLGYVLLPKLRRAQSPRERSSLILREIWIAFSLLVPCWILTWYLVPVLDDLFFGAKYPLTGNLVLAVIVASTAKALSGISTASVAGVASDRHLELSGLVSWAGVAVSLMAAYVGSGYGLAGVVYGVSLGWFLRIVVAAFIVRKHFAADGQADGAVERSLP